MPRKLRFCPPDFPVHVIQRGNNRNLCFTCDADTAMYANWLSEGAEKFHVAIHGWVFMTNHVHLLMTPETSDGISRLMQYLGRLYVRKFNYLYGRSGTLFEDRFKSCLIQDDEYLLTCLKYIELNPVRAGMVSDPGHYQWSSYGAHAFGRHPSIWTPHNRYQELAASSGERQQAYRDQIADSIGTDVIAKIRHCTNKGIILGTEKFRAQFKQLTGDRASG